MANKKYIYCFGFVLLTICIQFHEARALQSSYKHSRLSSRLFSSATTVESPTRRTIIIVASSATTFAFLPTLPSNANDADILSSSSAAAAETLLHVTVTVSPGAFDSVQEMDPSHSALYITARPSTADNVPRAILDGSRGKPPPVLVTRIPNVNVFPFECTLTANDVTVEGNSGSDDGNSSSSYWWQDGGLVVSARLDSDGVAATRDPSDLVGRNIILSSGKNHHVTVELQGRGAAGKFFTKKSSY